MQYLWINYKSNADLVRHGNVAQAFAGFPRMLQGGFRAISHRRQITCGSGENTGGV